MAGNVEGERQRVLRFTATERAFHWAFALPFLALLFSGLPLLFPSLRNLIHGYDLRMGIRLHLASAIFFLVSPVLVLLLGDRNSLVASARALFTVRGGNLLWLKQFHRFLIGLPCEMSSVGRFNGGQKLNALFLMAASIGLVVTGFAMWWGSPSVANASGKVHDLLTLAIIPPLLGHLFFALLHPKTRESLNGMLSGWVDAAWAKEHHPRWYASILQEGMDLEIQEVAYRVQERDANLPAGDYE